jgi:Zn-dependent protease with chaperone function
LSALLLSFLAPVGLEPLFNRYSPLQDAALAGELRRLAERAGLPVRDVLVQDASRRTRKANAYVSGLARTRRVVVSDTLLERAPPTEVRLVVAHELGHRRDRHVLLGTLLAMVGAVTATVVVWALLGTRVADPHQVPLVLLVGLGIGLASLPAVTALSRRWERAADRYSLELSGDGPLTRPPSGDSPGRTSSTSIRRACSTYSCPRTRHRPSGSRPAGLVPRVAAEQATGRVACIDSAGHADLARSAGRSGL